MRIAVNTRLLLKGKLEGIGWFTFENFLRITQQHPEHQFFFIFDRPYDNSFIFSDNITPIVLRPQSRHPFLWYIWFEWSVYRFIKNNSIDVFVSNDGYISLKSKIPQLAVIHDINFHYNPQGLPFLTSWYLNHFFPKFAAKATRIVTVSQSSKKSIVESYGIKEDKIDVVYNGASDVFRPLTQTEISNVRVEISSGEPYFVFVGAFNPRKNVGSLIEAYAVFREQVQTAVKLVLVGEPMFKTSEISRAYEQSQFKHDIIFAGRREVEGLRDIVGASLAMIYPSHFEGFGIPILEAMKCDIPLAVSNTTSMPEVAGDAAIYFDPANVQSIADSMVQLFNSNELRNRLTANGRVQREKFSWDIAAAKLYESILKCLE